MCEKVCDFERCATQELSKCGSLWELSFFRLNLLSFHFTFFAKKPATMFVPFVACAYGIHLWRKHQLRAGDTIAMDDDRDKEGVTHEEHLQFGREKEGVTSEEHVQSGSLASEKQEVTHEEHFQFKRLSNEPSSPLTIVPECDPNPSKILTLPYVPSLDDMRLDLTDYEFSVLNNRCIIVQFKIVLDVHIKPANSDKGLIRKLISDKFHHFEYCEFENLENMVQFWTDDAEDGYVIIDDVKPTVLQISRMVLDEKSTICFFSTHGSCIGHVDCVYVSPQAAKNLLMSTYFSRLHVNTFYSDVVKLSR